MTSILLTKSAFTIYAIAHECAHVEEMYYFDRAMPDIILKYKQSGLEGLLLVSAISFWQEYYATRRSIKHAEDGEYINNLTADMCEFLYASIDNLNALKKNYNYTRIDLKFITQILKIFSGLIGLYDGMNDDIVSVDKNHNYLLEQLKFPEGCYEWRIDIEKLQVLLRNIYNMNFKWDSLAIFDPIMTLINKISLRYSPIEY